MAQFLQLVNGIPRMVTTSDSLTIYDESVTIGAGGLSTGSPLSLPSAQTYDSEELEVYLNSQRLDYTDYTFEGIVPRTQVSFTFDLLENDVIRFRVDRSA